MFKAMLLTMMMLGNSMHGPVVEVPMPDMETCQSAAIETDWVVGESFPDVEIQTICIDHPDSKGVIQEEIEDEESIRT